MKDCFALVGGNRHERESNASITFAISYLQGSGEKQSQSIFVENWLDLAIVVRGPIFQLAMSA